MKFNAWTLTLIGAGIVTLPAVMQAEEKPTPVVSALSATTLSGYVDTSAQWNLGTGNLNTPNYSYGGPSKADGFNLNVVRVALESPVNTAESWGAGYKVDLWAGPDANTFNSQSTLSTGKSDFAVKQAYVALHAPVGNGIDFKVGVWDTIIGYEVSDAPYNPNFTRSYGYTMEPVSHTGILASYQFTEVLSASAGVADTMGPQINQRASNVAPDPDTGAPVLTTQRESYKAYMGSVTLTAPKTMGFLAGSTLSGVIINGFNSASVNNSPADQTSYYAGATLNTPVTGLKVGASYDYAGVPSQDSTDFLTHRAAYANAVGVYASYQLTEKLGVYARGEYASSDGAFTSTGVDADGNVHAARELWETTGTIQYDLWKNVLSRVEFRWDHASSDIYGDDFGKKNSFILLANIAYKF